MKIWSALEKDPFRAFFPLGAILALAGVVPWISQYFTHADYPRDLHRSLMINGFLLSFVCGFLMTAIPRFTGTHFATKAEILITLSALTLASIGAFSPRQTWDFFFSAAAVASLALFSFRRFLRKTTNPPHTFVFIGVGLFLWLASNLGQFASSIGISLPDAWTAIFQDLFSNGAIMSLILGVGGRLIPGILGWQEIVVKQRKQYETADPFLSRVPLGILVSVLVFLSSFFFESLIPLQLCFFMRGAVTLHFGIRYWVIYRFPSTRSFLTWSIWLCCWCLTLGYFVPAFWIGASVHALHVLFIGGFSLLTLLISTRVIFAHSPVGTEIEKTSPSILVFTGLILLSMVTRVTAILLPKIYLDHLGYAAAIWVVALITWGWLLVSGVKPEDIPAK
jgi:uncharacterized protein involved in response to NO